MISLEAIKSVIDSEGFSQDSSVNTIANTELYNHNLLPTSSLLKQTLSGENVLAKYQNATKELNKLKRLDPNEKIIDGYDIDWTGFEVTILGKTFKPQTSFELFDLIFRFLNYLYNLHISTNVIWNDPVFGEQRDAAHQLNWADIDRDINDPSYAESISTIDYQE